MLAAGGFWKWDHNGSFITDTAEVYSPSTGQWSTTGRMTQPRSTFQVVSLPDGRVLAAGGYIYTTSLMPVATAELYVPATGTWMRTGTMYFARDRMQMVVLRNGLVLQLEGRWHQSCMILPPGCGV